MSGEAPRPSICAREIGADKSRCSDRVCGQLEEERCGDGLSATRCVCDFWLLFGERVTVLQIDVDVAEAPV